MVGISQGNVRRNGIAEAAKEDPHLADLLHNIGDLAKCVSRSAFCSVESDNSG